jgi:hypothetical protein
MSRRLNGFFTLLLVLVPFPCPGAFPDPCDGYGTALIVDTVSHTLWMCQENRAAGVFPVSIGRGGADKRNKGDRKTPLGEYELGVPRSSGRFRLFIPVGYPKADQISRGFSGGNIGIHGPHRQCLWLGEDSAKVDWTHGCIAVGTDDDIAAVARWVNEQKVNKVIIR